MQLNYFDLKFVSEFKELEYQRHLALSLKFFLKNLITLVCFAIVFYSVLVFSQVIFLNYKNYILIPVMISVVFAVLVYKKNIN